MRKHYRVRSLIQKHSRLLTFIGALIVFMTFVVKEGLRDHLKDTVDSVNAAESLLTIRADNTAMLDALRSLDVSIAFFRQAATRPSEPGESLPVEEGARLTGERLKNTRESLEVVSRFLATVPKPEANRVTLEQLLSSASSYQSDLDTFREDFIDQIGPEDRTEKQRSELRMIEVEIYRLSKATDVFRAKAIADAEEYKGNEQRLYAMCSFASYGLYALGWGLGLVVRMYGVEGPGGDE